jgi:inorganic pyrophosphatase
MNKNNLIFQMPLGKNPPFEVNCVVEVPKGGTNKYEYDEEVGAFKLDRALYEAVFFPAEYGFIPQTLNEKDGDPLDVMVLATFPTFPGCLVSCRPIGILRLVDSGEEDDKIIAVSANDPRFEEIKELEDLPIHIRKEIKNFFENYAELQTNKKIKIDGWSGKDKAHELIKQAKKDFQEKK